jgi:hypothetical protein
MRIAGEEGDRRDKCLRQGRPDRREQTADSGLGNAESMARPFDGVGKKLRARKDYYEAQSKNSSVKQNYRLR